MIMENGQGFLEDKYKTSEAKLEEQSVTSTGNKKGYFILLGAVIVIVLGIMFWQSRSISKQKKGRIQVTPREETNKEGEDMSKQISPSPKNTPKLERQQKTDKTGISEVEEELNKLNLDDIDASDSQIEEDLNAL